MTNQKSIIKSIDKGNYNRSCVYILPADKALICYLEQTINHNFKTWDYFANNFIDATGKSITRNQNL